jgi:hypothetical protein
MKIIPCEQNSEEIKKFFDKISSSPLKVPQNTNPRTFGNSYSSPRYSIPISDSSSNKQSNTTKDVHIISSSESAVEQAKSDLKHEDRGDGLIPQVSTSIKDLQIRSIPQSTGVKRKRTSQKKSSPIKKSKPTAVLTERKKYKKLKKIF